MPSRKVFRSGPYEGQIILATRANRGSIPPGHILCRLTDGRDAQTNKWINARWQLVPEEDYRRRTRVQRSVEERACFVDSPNESDLPYKFALPVGESLLSAITESPAHERPNAE